MLQRTNIPLLKEPIYFLIIKLGRQYWNQEGKNNAIWYDKNNYWIVNDKRFIGQAQGLLWNPDSTAPCPNIGNWKFWDWDTSDWITPNTNDIIFSTLGNPSFISR